ncbi:hypothetical protein [Sphingomonas sp. YL-JM2C]
MNDVGGILTVGTAAILLIGGLLWLGARVIAAAEREIAVLFGSHDDADDSATTRLTSGKIGISAGGAHG